MTLKEKLHAVYDLIDHIDKLGENTQQHYDYARAADVTRAVRKELFAQRVYAEINYDFYGPAFTIARAKDPNAPFAAVLVKCSLVFHDLDSPEELTGSGLGGGADTGDKSVYKAQTGALKYALKNAFLIPDEADPEADESVDEPPARRRDAEPDFQDAKRGVSRQEPPRESKQDARPTQAPAENPRTEAPSTKSQDSAPSAKSADAPSTISDAPAVDVEHGDAYEGPDHENDRMPTEAELDVYRKKFSALGTDLADKGKLKASKGMPAPVKLKTFLLSVTKADSPKVLTVGQWDEFFKRVDATVAREAGYVGLAEIVNKANGIEK